MVYLEIIIIFYEYGVFNMAYINRNEAEKEELEESINLTMDTNRHIEHLKADCQKCFGLCCVALYFSASEGFPTNKTAGKPCINLEADFSCSVHSKLWKLGLKGCTAFDCFGAGQRVAQITYRNSNWKQTPAIASQMFDVFGIMRQLHEMLWYLSQVHMLTEVAPIKNKLVAMINNTERLTGLGVESILSIDIAAHRAEVNMLLLQSSELVRAQFSDIENSPKRSKKTTARGRDFFGKDLRKVRLTGENLRGAYLIAANLAGVDLSGTDLIGADLRDANLSGANLTHSLFVTQAQINTAKGDLTTKLPCFLTYPSHWTENVTLKR